MKHFGNRVEDVKIAYIGGGSKGWAWTLMSDLGQAEDISGQVALYDIDFEAAKRNEIIGNKTRDAEGCKSVWDYKAVETIGEALTGADFVIISIMPATLDEMASDVHTPEKYGIYQSVGDTSGPGGIIRALRTIPMIEEIANAVKQYCPKAWVINYTNPMTICMNTLFKTFPEIKAFGCCHEVFGTQKLLASAVKEYTDFKDVDRQDIKVNVLGVNHFTWITKAQYKNIDIFPLYDKLAVDYKETGYTKGNDDNWLNSVFQSKQMVKFDLFKRFGYIAAAGDRHLAEFCPRQWYLDNPETVEKWGFALTSVDFRRIMYKDKLERSDRLISGEEKFAFNETGEEGINQIRALLGLDVLVTNVNIQNKGQIPNLPLGAVVETNATFTADAVIPVMAGEIPQNIYPLISRICGEQQQITEAGINRDLDKAFMAFYNDPLVSLPIDKAKALFDEMVENTKEYLKEYFD